MTRDEIEALTDDELVERVATEVMGWHKEEDEYFGISWMDKDGIHKEICEIWNPLSLVDMNVAWDVMEKVEQFVTFVLREDVPGDWNTTFTAELTVKATKTNHTLYRVYSAQCAICIASLLAVQCP